MSEYMIKPKTKRGEATLEKLIDAAAAVFYEKAFMADRFLISPAGPVWVTGPSISILTAS